MKDTIEEEPVMTWKENRTQIPKLTEKKWIEDLIGL